MALMSEYIEDQPGSRDSIDETIEDYYCSQTAFFEVVDQYASIPTAKKLVEVKKRASELLTTFDKTVCSILEDQESSPDERAMMLNTVFLNSEKARIEHFNNLMDSEDDFSALEYDSDSFIISVSQKIELGENEAVRNVLVVNYMKCASTDLDYLQELINQSRQSKFIRLSQVVGNYALDVSKIGLGVGIGVLVFNYLKGKKVS
jgi:dynactin complex subunit